ncbi:MAG: hypothetical protein A3F72_07510 [Bacteroidetes bacterium RIFCSPLOWO2_12_FULL_35_15]|nr:MAG: hypothetical protein A3F72_07510 [Bacteroidetes bacterium RIFCSPLOWO2_12_FULL_35_15]
MKLKKAVILFLTFIYLFVASGVAFNFHYCKGKINNISLAFGQKHDNCCGKKKMTKKNCCKEKTAVLKINDTQYSSTSLKTPTTSINTIDACFSQISFHLNDNFEKKVISRIDAPPDIYRNPIYLQYRILII